MQNLFENLINHNRQLDERQAAEKASVHPRHDSHVFDLSTVTQSTLLTQDLSDLVAKLPFDYMLKILYGNLDTGAKCSIAELAKAGITGHDFGLHEHTVGTVRRMINRQVSGFTPYVADRSYREKSLGWYQLNAEKVPALRERKPVISVTQVSAAKVFPARLMMACSKSTIDRAYAGEMSDTIPGLSQATIIKADNTLSLPLEPRYMVLVPNLLCWDGDNRCQYAWDLIRSLFRNRFDATALDHLYWAYNRASVSWKPAITPPTAGPDPMPFFDLFLDFPAGRESMNGIIRHSVWHEGGPVGSDRIIATMFTLLSIKSAVGPFPSKISAWLRDIVLYGSSFRSPDPAAGVTLNFMDPKKFTDVKADVFWAPSLDQAGSVDATTIAIPVSSPDQVCSVASKFLKDELRYGVDVTYGPNPTVWVTQTNDGYSPKEAGVYVRKMAVSVYWMSMWNISNAAVGRVDIWHAGVRPSSGMVFSQTTALLTYCYVPLQAKAEQAPIYTKSATDFSLSKLNALVRTNLTDPPKKVLVRKEESSVVEGPQNAMPQQLVHQAPPSPQPSPNGSPQVFQFGQDAFAEVSQLLAQHSDSDGAAPMESG